MSSTPSLPKKHCRQCGRDREIVHFHKRTGARDGLRSWCIDCDVRAKRVWATRRTLAAEPTVKTWVCIACRVEKRASAFSRSTCRTTGISSTCRVCSSAAARVWRATNRKAHENGRPPVERKVCHRCETEKSAGGFHRSRASASGLSTYCKACYRRERERRRVAKARVEAKQQLKAAA